MQGFAGHPHLVTFGISYLEEPVKVVAEGEKKKKEKLWADPGDGPL